jgi:DNA-binding MarR family transcriptional regulator
MYRVIPILSNAASTSEERALAAALHDLAWLLPRTADVDAERDPRLRPLPASELEIMRLLVRRPGLTVGDVAGELGLQRTNASTSIRTLIGRGLLQSARDPEDGRVVRLSPTTLATEQRDVREQAWGTALAGRLQRLSTGDRTRLLAAAEPLRALASMLAAER